MVEKTNQTREIFYMAPDGQSMKMETEAPFCAEVAVISMADNQWTWGLEQLFTASDRGHAEILAAEVEKRKGIKRATLVRVEDPHFQGGDNAQDEPEVETPSKPAKAKTNLGSIGTKAMYDAFYTSYDFFNRELFDGKLGPTMLVFHRKRNARGYFWPSRWSLRVEGDQEGIHEIALSPDHMGRTIPEVLSTLVHEMCHEWDEEYGKPPQHGHGKTWGAKMEEVGLMPSDTGEPGGKKTGRKVTHYIIPGGAFDRKVKDLLQNEGVDFSWFSAPDAPAPRKKDRSKVKHTCGCGTNIWGKEGIEVMCPFCDQPFRENG